VSAARRLSAKRTPRQIALDQLDLFGDVPVTRQDVYAWLMAVVEMDPESLRAAGYVRQYRVLDKIVAAKLNGSFDEIVSPARASARYRELAAAGCASQGAKNSLGVGEHAPDPRPLALPFTPTLRTPRRSPEVIARERERAKLAKLGRESLRASALNRLLPTRLPSLTVILEDLGNPDAHAIGAALHVHCNTVRRWLRHGDAPHAEKLALFWMTRWGVSTVEANAYNDAINSALVARMREQEAEQLRGELRHVERIADFGSANDPLPSVQSRQIGPQHEQPAASQGPATTADAPVQRNARCAA
jgi:hypothetical protein